MYTLTKRLGVAAVAIGAVCSLASTASAQVKLAPSPQRIFPVNPNPYIAPGVRLSQYAYNVSVLGKVYSQIPPYLLGYNQTGFGGVYQPGTFIPSPYGGGYAPYSGGYGGSPGGYGGYSGYGGYPGGYGPTIDPLTGQPVYGGGSGYGGYSSGGNPYYNPYSGGYYYGSAQELQAIGQLGLTQEQARILREQANQAKLDTRKKLVDTLAYIRANQYTFTQEQADIAKRLLERVQVTPTNTEVTSGKSLNILLKDLGKFTSKQLLARSVTIDEDILRLLNVTGSHGNMGLLRNDGQIPWPPAFSNKDVLPDDLREAIDNYAKLLFFQAANGNGKLDANVLKNLDVSVGKLRDNLNKNVNKLGADYLDGARFLEQLEAAVTALKKGDAVLFLDFNQKFAKGGRTVQELVEYMTKNGLTFAPAMPGEERAYFALQAALSAQSLALHNEVAAAGK
jgi:hypothetical protein